MAGFLDAVCGEHGRLSRQARALATDWLDRFADLAVKLALIHAARRCRMRDFRHGGPPRRRTRSGEMRAMIGSALRKSLRHADLRQRLNAIVALLRDPEAAIAALARRLQRGFTRRGAPRPQWRDDVITTRVVREDARGVDTS
ncbi:MAG: hypothetical protein ABUL42_03470 [Terricaulis silvestris]